ncbi:piwi-like protein Siwi isoform X2 [Nylanderia fulva]|uniref:piwi-like protein Siwi isoform X2 n=1 Tax=Nylanderia fulva TaxID=613905 RepID=UPI0010FB785F|nr:piwi-like protein Siwi isoform X2 [Nylanderia fulva]
MSQKGGRGTRGRATQRLQQAHSAQEQQLPHAQPSTSSGGAVRRPGQPAGQASAGTGARGQRIGEKGDGAGVGMIGRGMEKMGIQAGGGGGDRDAGAGGMTGSLPLPVVSSGRGSARGKRTLPPELFHTRPAHVQTKIGLAGKKITLQANYFKLLKSTDWAINQYHVDFAPEEDRTIVRKGLLKLHAKSIGAYIFDGTVLYTSRRLPEPLTFTSTRQSDEQHITITIRPVRDMRVGDSHYIQFFNIIMRKCYEFLRLQLVGRNYFDPGNKVEIRDYRLELWPGYVTSIRQHERDILMCAEITSKVMRLDTLGDTLSTCYNQNRAQYKENFASTVIGTVVLTDYNNNTYRIEDVDFNTTPSSTFFLKNGDKITYMEYYKRKGITIRNVNQPMLVTKSKTRSRQAEEAEKIYLVPELCRATGLTDSMRENFKLMSAVAKYTRLGAKERVDRLKTFNQRLNNQDNIVREFSEWNLQLDNKLLDVPARILPKEMLYVGGDSAITYEEEDGDWGRPMQKKSCLVNKDLRNWVLLITERDRPSLSAFLDKLSKVSLGLRFRLEPPQVHTLRDDRPGTYSEMLERILSKQTPDLVFCVVSNNRSDRYSAIKKKCCVDRPVPSQVCVFKTMTHRNVMSIATKIAIQMNCKLGGAPWSVDIPMDGLMIVGFDVCHDTTTKTKDFGAMVATLDRRMTKYFSTVSAHSNGDELSNELCNNIRKATETYRRVNNVFPSRIVIYRDGVGEGQIPQVKEREVEEIKKVLNNLYNCTSDRPTYKLAFIIVTKRLNTRLFFNGENPKSGTVVDDVITSPIKYDFFIVSQHVLQGTVTPTSYSIIYDNLGLDADKLQRMSYKLTHMYFNCSNTVRVPAPCHYAHKLAFLVSKFIHQPPNSSLENTLYFL